MSVFGPSRTPVPCEGSSDTYLVGCIGWLHTRSLEKESDGVQALALSLTESSHELFQLCASLDLEEDLVIVVGDFDIEVF